MIVAHDAHHTRVDFPIASDYKAGRQTHDAAEFRPEIVVPKYNRIWNRQRLAIHIEFFLRNERAHHRRSFVIHRHAQYSEAFIAVFFLELDHPRRFDLARLAPGGPEIDEHDFAPQASKRNLTTIERLKRHVWRRPERP